MENPINSGSKKRSSKGRQRIPMDRRREKLQELLVTFSKRKSGLYKKISELSMVCGVHFALLIISPSGKLFTFAYPSLEFVSTQLWGNSNQPNKGVFEILKEASCRSNVDELTRQLAEVTNLLDEETKRGKMLEKMAKEGRVKSIVDTPIADLSDDEVKMLEGWLKKVQVGVHERINQLNGM